MTARRVRSVFKPQLSTKRSIAVLLKLFRRLDMHPADLDRVWPNRRVPGHCPHGGDRARKEIARPICSSC
jgi:hypothetical protein